MSKVFISTDHSTHYPVGAASIVIADTHDEATSMLKSELEKHGLDPNKKFTLHEITGKGAIVLCDGEY